MAMDGFKKNNLQGICLVYYVNRSDFDQVTVKANYLCFPFSLWLSS